MAFATLSICLCSRRGSTLRACSFRHRLLLPRAPRSCALGVQIVENVGVLRFSTFRIESMAEDRHLLFGHLDPEGSFCHQLGACALKSHMKTVPKTPCSWIVYAQAFKLLPHHDAQPNYLCMHACTHACMHACAHANKLCGANKLARLELRMP